MNGTIKLPNDIKGKWIWDSRDGGGDCQRLIFRGDFMLKEMPGEAELWVASSAFYQLKINGRMCTAGPIPHTGAKKSAYAVKVDVTHMLEVGINRISVCAHTENANLSGIKRAPGAFWLQIDVDGKPIEWSEGASWAVKVATAYKNTGLRTAPCDVFTECVDLGTLSGNWNTTDVDRLISSGRNSGTGWRAPDIVREADSSFCILEPFNQSPRVSEWRRNPDFIFAGTVSPYSQVSWVSFGDALGGSAVPGTYMAETYVFCAESVETDAIVICDVPYVLFVNDVKVKSQAVPQLVYRGGMSSLRSSHLQPQDYALPYMKMSLESGWNRVMLVAECISGYDGATFIWPGLPDGALGFSQKGDQPDGGWSVAGPLSVPMALIYPAMLVDGLVKYPFFPNVDKPFDPSAFYFARSYEAEEEVPEQYPVTLETGKFILTDFGATRYGYPYFRMRGNPGDVVDVVCGEHLQEAELIACQPGERRNVSTVILKGGVNEWMCSAPRGARYIMIIARKVTEDISVDSVEMWHEAFDIQDVSSFSCSLPTLDEVWNVGVTTLDATLQRIYMDSPTGDQAQALPDSMIQSWAAYYVKGQYSMAAHAIESFARSQFETGELNAVSPSSLFQALPDYSLSWPVWLQRHYLHTGDRDFLLKMMPALHKLMYYYDQIAVSADGPLGDLQDYIGVYAFIDYGNMERRGITTALNGMYCRALLSASVLSEMAGQNDLAPVYRERAGAVAAKVSALLWDEEKKLFADSYVDGQRTETCSWQSNVLAIYGGIAKPEQYDDIWNQLFTDEVPLELKVDADANNPYFKYYVLETAFAIGKSRWALSLIHYYWGSMVHAGASTWWEMYDPSHTVEYGVGIVKRCCGYGVSPNAFLISELVGIRPAEPGMKMVYFNPIPGDVTWARGVVPTPNGSITVHWKLEDDGIFNVSISATFDLEVIPVLEPGIAEQAIFNVSEKVSIMTSDEE